MNWRAIWPLLERMPADTPLAILDAGCGDGAWCRRLAQLRPRWQLTGIDCDRDQIRRARERETREPLGNVAYLEGDFLQGIPGSYDVILSIASLHYAGAAGRGPDAFRAIAVALARDGRAILLVPRRREDQPSWRSLPRPQSWPVFTNDQIARMSAAAGLTVHDLRGLYGRWCVLGKQAAMWGSTATWKRVAAAPLQLAVRGVPFGLVRNAASRSYAMRVVVRR